MFKIQSLAVIRKVHVSGVTPCQRYEYTKTLLTLCVTRLVTMRRKVTSLVKLDNVRSADMFLEGPSQLTNLLARMINTRKHTKTHLVVTRTVLNVILFDRIKIDTVLM